MEPHRLRAYILLLVVTAIWGIAGPIIKFTLGGIPPLLFLTYRFGLSAILGITLLVLSRERLPRNPKTLLMLLVYGLFTSTISLGLLFFGLEETTVLDMTLITLIGPLLIAIAGVIFLKERITNQERLGMTIALLGTVFTIFEPIIQNGVGTTRLSGNILVFLYLLIATIPAVLAKKLLREGTSPSLMTNLSFIVGFLTLLPFAIYKYSLFNIWHLAFDISPAYHAGVFYMAFLSGSLAYYLQNKAQKTIEISEAAVFSYLYPLFSAPLAILWLGEKITPQLIFGGIIIATGVIIAEYKKRHT